jgi:hypothetical protein
VKKKIIALSTPILSDNTIEKLYLNNKSFVIKDELDPMQIDQIKALNKLNQSRHKFLFGEKKRDKKNIVFKSRRIGRTFEKNENGELK